MRKSQGFRAYCRRRAPEVFSRAGRFTDAFALLYPTAAFSVGQSRIQCIVLNIGSVPISGALSAVPDSQEEIVQTLILTLHIIVCVLLVILILLQSAKKAWASFSAEATLPYSAAAAPAAFWPS